MEYMPDATVRIPTVKDKEFFKYWLLLLEPFHNLTKREMDVAVNFLYNRYLLSKKISDASLLEENAVNEASKKRVIEECGVSLPHFQVIMGKLKKSGIFSNGKLNPKFIPNLKQNASNFQLVFLFDLKDEPK